MKDEIKEILDNPKILMLSYGNYISLDDYVKLKDCITNLQEEYQTELDENFKLSEWLVQKQKRIEELEKETDYLKDIVSNTELSDEIKKADKWSIRELYKINYQRYQVNKRLRKENERLIKINKEQANHLISKDNLYYEDYKSRNEKARDKIQYIIDYGFDYDGFNTVESLKGLIDMLVDYARQSKDILNGDDNN